MVVPSKPGNAAAASPAGRAVAICGVLLLGCLGLSGLLTVDSYSSNRHRLAAGGTPSDGGTVTLSRALANMPLADISGPSSSRSPPAGAGGFDGPNAYNGAGEGSQLFGSAKRQYTASDRAMRVGDTAMGYAMSQGGKHGRMSVAEPTTTESPVTTTEAPETPEPSPTPAPLTRAPAMSMAQQRLMCNHTAEPKRIPPSERSKKLTVVFILNRVYSSKARYTIWQALRQGLKVIVVGYKSPQKVMKHFYPMTKIVVPSLEKYLAPDDMILVADAGDVTFMCGEQCMLAKFYEVAEPGTILLSAEHELWAAPRVRRTDFHDCPSLNLHSGDGRYSPYPNTGLFMGHRKDVVDFLVRGLNITQPADPNDWYKKQTVAMDQPLILYNWVRRNVSSVVTMDHFSTLFQSMFVFSSNTNFVQPHPFENGISPACPGMWDKCRAATYLNASGISLAGTSPPLLHWNGPAKMRLVSLLNTIPQYVNYNCDMLHLYATNITVVNNRLESSTPTAARFLKSTPPSERRCRDLRRKLSQADRRRFNIPDEVVDAASTNSTTSGDSMVEKPAAGP